MREIAADKREPVRWILLGGSAPNAYLAAARTQAKEHKVGLILRRGGRNNIGLLGLAPEESFEAQRRRWAVRGAPHTWSPQDFTEVLQNQGFKVFGDVTPPAHKGGVWCFKASWDKKCLMLDIGEKKPLVIAPWTPPAYKKPATEPLWGARGWVARASSVVEIQDGEMPSTEPDSPTQKKESDEEEAKDSAKRNLEGKGLGSPPKKSLRGSAAPASPAKVTEDMDKLALLLT